MQISKTALKEKPKRPLNAYFKFRNQELAKSDPNDRNRTTKIKIAYDQLSEKEMNKLLKECEKQRDQYLLKVRAWEKKFGIEKEPARSKSAAKTDKSKGKSKSKGRANATKDRSDYDSDKDGKDNRRSRSKSENRRSENKSKSKHNRDR